MDILPDEVLAQIAAWLDATSLGRASCTCTALARACGDPHLWKRMCADVGILSRPWHALFVGGTLGPVDVDVRDRWRWLYLAASRDRRRTYRGGTMGVVSERRLERHGWFDAHGRQQGYGVVAVNTSTFDAWYEGMWMYDERHGYGVSFDAEDRQRYEGQWQRNSRQGLGTVTNADTGCAYDGEWRGSPHGRGKLCCASDGSTYEGGWCQGRPHGWITMALPAESAAPFRSCPNDMCDRVGRSFDFIVRRALRSGPWAVVSVGAWYKSGDDTHARTRVSYADGSTFEYRQRSIDPLVPHGRGTLTLPDGTGLHCLGWIGGALSGVVRRPRPTCLFVAIEIWERGRLRDVAIVRPIGADTGAGAVFSKARWIIHRIGGRLDSASEPATHDAYVYHPDPACDADAYDRFIALIAAKSVPWTDGMYDAAQAIFDRHGVPSDGHCPALPLVDAKGSRINLWHHEGIDIAADPTIPCPLSGLWVPLTECMATRHGALCWKPAVKCWLRKGYAGRWCIDEDAPHRCDFGGCRVLPVEASWASAGLSLDRVGGIIRKAFGAVRNVYQRVESREGDDLDAHDLRGTWKATVVAMLVTECPHLALANASTTPHERADTAHRIAGGCLGFGGARLQGVALGRRQEILQHQKAVAVIGVAVELHRPIRSMIVGRSAGAASSMRIARCRIPIAWSASPSLAACTTPNRLPARTGVPTSTTSVRPTEGSMASSA